MTQTPKSSGEPALASGKECACRKALKRIANSPFMGDDSYDQLWNRIELARATLATPCQCEQVRAERDQRTRELFLEACETKRLRADLKESLDALEACVGYYRDACGYVIGFPRNAAALLAKHRPASDSAPSDQQK